MPLFAKLIVIVGSHHIRIESQYVVVRDSIGNGVFMNHVAEYGFGHDFMLGVFFEHRCTREAESKALLNVFLIPISISPNTLR